MRNVLYLIISLNNLPEFEALVDKRVKNIFLFEKNPANARWETKKEKETWYEIYKHRWIIHLNNPCSQTFCRYSSCTNDRWSRVPLKGNQKLNAVRIATLRIITACYFRRQINAINVTQWGERRSSGSTMGRSRLTINRE